MPLNYSKWDSLQLSDDSDIECHPNIDKKSFIRLKQRQIHQQREERKVKIEQLKHEAELNKVLLEKIKDLLQNTTNEGSKYLKQTAAKLFEAQEADPSLRKTSDDKEPTIDQMIFNLITQVLSKIKDQKGDDHDQAARKELEFHLNRLTERESKRVIELEKAQAEAKRYITSEDVHDGFDVSYVDKTPSAAIDETVSQPKKTKSTTKKVKSTKVELLNPKSQDSGEVEEEDSEDDDEDDDEELPRLSESAAKFAKIKSSDYSSSLSAIQKDPSLYLEEQTTDALLVEAFESEMKGKGKYAKNCVHQGLLLQYCRKLGRDGVRLFFEKVGAGSLKAIQVFIDDVNTTYERISSRCATIKEERAKDPEPKEQIQLVATNPNTSITFEVPDGPPPPNLEITSDDQELKLTDAEIEEVRRVLTDRWETFNSFPKKLQKALKSKDLERVNKVLGSLELEEAEKVVGDLDRVGILSFSESGIIDGTKHDQEDPKSLEIKQVEAEKNESLDV
ncbi:hypothetical protein BY996DRAFT_4584152 [Phakopsora pachyrhizi]|uniref:Hsp90 chaperone protein kinase-targeting subunit n=1 Tax=Phakopsora pachyrhizi TaxID=170000 RepID=A0AAV0AQV0_PHAPC|nr:hypothetical protein BY996DRAFT_4584152 [Phakopsora pachyrhizi]CAH7670368.1 hypothetical protein PPACK8108_LOCUS5066 [Phakopsora pachyrhizi]